MFFISQPIDLSDKWNNNEEKDSRLSQPGSSTLNAVAHNTGPGFRIETVSKKHFFPTFR